MSDLVLSWELALRSERKSPDTLRIYLRAARHWQDYLGERSLLTATRTDVRAYVSHCHTLWGPSTVSMYFRALRRFYRFLVDEEELAKSPFTGIPQPKPSDRPTRTATRVEASSVLSVIPARSKKLTDLRDRAMLLILTDTPIRRGELAGMNIEHVDLKGRTIVVTGKGNRRRIMPITARTANALDRYLRRHPNPSPDSPLWFSQRTQGRLTADGIRLVLDRRVLKADGVDHLNVHSFRHGFAHHFREQGGSEGDLMTIGGWQSRAMLDRYGKSLAHIRADSAYRRIMDN